MASEGFYNFSNNTEDVREPISSIAYEYVVI